MALPVFKTARSRRRRDGRFDSFPSPPRGVTRAPRIPSLRRLSSRYREPQGELDRGRRCPSAVELDSDREIFNVALMLTLAHALEARLRERGPAPALLWDDVVFSFAALDVASFRLAAGLRKHGVRRGDRVAVGFPNSPELVVAVLAVLRSGAVLVPLNPASTPGELDHMIRESGACLTITHEEQASRMRGADLPTTVVTGQDRLVGEAMEALACTNSAHGHARLADGREHAAGSSAVDRGRLNAEDPALIVYTSGTTGLPKGVVLSHRALLANLSAIAAEWRRSESDRLLLSLPCFHLHGLGLGILGSLLAGSSIVLRRRFVLEETLDLLDRYNCNVFFGVPTMYNRLVQVPEHCLAPRTLRQMRLWVSGSAPLTAATFERFRERFGYALMNRYGMTETGFVLSTPHDGPRRPGVVGRPVPGVEVCLGDPDRADAGELLCVGDGRLGELFVRGESLFSGYWQRPEDTRQAFVGGFFRSGDLAVREPDGMYRIEGRRSVDIIKSGGFKIGAVEIENCLQGHPGVAEVAVVGLPDADRGEVVVAVVTPRPDFALAAEELDSFARRHLAPHKVPARYVFTDEIPRTGPGKFKKKELIARLAGLNR